MIDLYGSDVLGQDPHRRNRPTVRDFPAKLGEVVEEAASGWCGAITQVEKAGGMHVVHLQDRHGRTRAFPLGPGFLVEGKPVNLVVAPIRPIADPRSVTGAKLTNSGSRAVAPAPAKVARSSRIWVEGRHDAELVEHVWGDDLRHEGVVVEILEGVDHLQRVLEEFGPTPSCRAGVLVDHLVKGSKESILAEQVTARFGANSVLIAGHPFVDVWQAIKPERVGLRQWPQVPRGTDIKVGSLRALGLPADNQADIARGWQAILRRVRDFRDLQPELLGPVEMLIDFVTAPGTD